MPTRRGLILIGFLAWALACCQAQSPHHKTVYPSPPADALGAKPVAFLDGQPLTLADLRTPLLEAVGGEVLSDLVLERSVQQQLAQQGLAVTPELIEPEREVLLRSMSSEADQAQRLFNEVRNRRGLGEWRFKQLLATRAGLRLLVKDRARVEESAVRRLYELRYGARYEARLIVVGSVAEAAQAAQRARAGESFADLAVALSTDSSRAQGGLIPPISPADPTYPAALRGAVQSLTVGQVSDPIMLEQGFAVLKVEGKTQPQSVAFESVRAELEALALLEAQERLMQQLARTLMDQAKVNVLDPALGKSWENRRRQER